VFDIASRKVIRCYEDPTGGSISAAAFHPDGTALASGCADASIKVPRRPLLRRLPPALAAIGIAFQQQAAPRCLCAVLSRLVACYDQLVLCVHGN
jgi:hypothetical protein